MLPCHLGVFPLFQAFSFLRQRDPGHEESENVSGSINPSLQVVVENGKHLLGYKHSEEAQIGQGEMDDPCQ